MKKLLIKNGKIVLTSDGKPIAFDINEFKVEANEDGEDTYTLILPEQDVNFDVETGTLEIGGQ